MAAEPHGASNRRKRRSNGATVTGDRYLLPKHTSESDRLDVQHYAMLAAVGANHMAPVERPRRILDVGSGSGQWGFDLCATFPTASVVGFDLQPGKGDGPANYRFVRGNLLQGLPFAAGRFDLVHQRLLTPGVPLRLWATVVEDLVRVTCPGGWVELVEITWTLSPAGPATDRLAGLAGQMGRTLGLDTTGIVFRSLDQGLRRAGLTGVQRRDLQLPVGEWGAQVGSLMATDLRAAFTRMCDVYEARGLLPAEEGRELIAAAMAECELLGSRFSMAIAIGRKPGRADG